VSFHRRSTCQLYTNGSAGQTQIAEAFGINHLHPLVPEIDATCRFWISGDDHCELWLSSTDFKFYKRLIAHVGPGPDGDPESGAWTHPLDWDKFAGQRSADITPTKGSRHFIEILLKHGNDPDHFAIAWQDKLPNQQSWSPREVIPAGFLVAHPGDPADLDDDYLPTSSPTISPWRPTRVKRSSMTTLWPRGLHYAGEVWLGCRSRTEAR